jgi:pyruvate/2-oxoacid:ferredoxin oxidoreductase alpha subunit
MKVGKGQVKIINGNTAAAYAAMLCRPDVVTSYPITPMSRVSEQLSAFHADGILDAEIVEVEGEKSSMNVVAGPGISRANAEIRPPERGRFR